MPFDLSVIRDGATYSLTAGTPYKLASAEGLAGPAVTRATMRAPGQDGDTDYGYHLEPRLITLAVQFTATSGSVLDGYRDTFMNVFRPERSASFANPTGDPRFQAHTPLTLQVTRDDGEVRRIDCYATGPADVPLVTEHRPGHLHRAVVTLVAPNPTWYGTALTTVAIGPWLNSGTPFLGTITYAGSYYALPTIAAWPEGTAPVSVENVTTGGSLTYNFDLSDYPDFSIDVEGSTTSLGTAVASPTNTLDYRVLRIAPHPVASGGSNVYRITAVSSTGGGGTAMYVTYRDRYLSY